MSLFKLNEQELREKISEISTKIFNNVELNDEEREYLVKALLRIEVGCDANRAFGLES